MLHTSVLRFLNHAAAAKRVGDGVDVRGRIAPHRSRQFAHRVHQEDAFERLNVAVDAIGLSVAGLRQVLKEVGPTAPRALRRSNRVSRN